MALAAGDVVAILDAILEGLQVIGTDYRYLHLNDTAARHGRATRQSLLGRTMMECYPGIERTPMFAQLRSCLEQRTSHVLENEFTFPDGSRGWFELRIEPVPQGACILSIDVTARRQAQEQLQRSKRMESIGLLAAGIAHDFNNLLTIVLSQSELALDRAGGPARVDIETIAATARSAAALTRQLLACARQTVYEREVVDLGELLRSVERVVRQVAATPTQVRFVVPAHPVHVVADRAQLEQMLLNLLFDLQARTQQERRIELELRSGRIAGGIDLERRAHWATIAVTDSGLELDAAARTHLFEPFQIGRDRSRGLGLAAAWGIVKQHGGEIGVQPAPGGGTTFEVTLPITERVPLPTSSIARAAGVAARVVTVLVAEDDPLVANVIDTALTGAGYRVQVARSGGEAVLLWERRPDAFALLLTDVAMPDMSGPELVQRLRRDRPSLPVICTSGYGDVDVARHGSVPEGVVFVAKPFTPSALVGKVRVLLGAV